MCCSLMQILFSYKRRESEISTKDEIETRQAKNVQVEMNREHSGKDIMYISSLRASFPGRSGVWVGIERRACNCVSGI